MNNKKLISHRGNINGKFDNFENEPKYIDVAINKGFDVEVDVWYVETKQSDKVLMLGHDNPQYIVDFKWFSDRLTKLWVHCKNVEAINFFKTCKYNFNYFWHETDTITLTSLNYIWAYPGKQPIENSIAVMPELNNDDTTKCLGICSDYVEKYK
jgi:hypothetical protein